MQAFDPEKRSEFLERIELVKKEEKYRTMAMNMVKSSQNRYNSLKRGVEWMVYDDSPEQKFGFEMNKIEDYSKFFIDTMKNSGIANHIIYNKGKSSDLLVGEITKLLK